MSEISSPLAAPASGPGPVERTSETHRPAVSVGLVGDFDPSIAAHRAIPEALRLAGERAGIEVAADWIDTDDILSARGLERYDGLWCVPGSPYHNAQGALTAIRHAREHEVPFLGTCGGFQHVIVDHARNVLGWRGANHAESVPRTRLPVVSTLPCPLIEQRAEIRLEPASLLAKAYGQPAITETYHCRYGMNSRLERRITWGSLRATGRDPDGDVRAVELDSHPFFVATLFQPERVALDGRCPPLVLSFVLACAA